MADETTTISPERQALLDRLDSTVQRGEEQTGLDRGEVGDELPEAPKGPTDQQQAARQQLLAELDRRQQEKAQAEPINPILAAGLRTFGGPVGQAAVEAMNQPQVGPAIREAVKGSVSTARMLAGGTLGATAGVANYWDVGRTDNLVGWSLPDVKALRDNLVKEQQGIQAQLEEKVNSGAAGDLGQVPDLSLQNAQFQRQIDEANGILASGMVKTAPDAGFVPTRGYRSLAGTAASAILDQKADEAQRALIPTTEQLDASPVGQVMQGVGTFATLAPFAFAGPVVDLAVQYAYGAGAQYQDAKAQGASDSDAENAALVGGLGQVPNALILSGIAGKLAKKMAGLTTTQVLTEVAKGAAFGGAGGAGFQAYQNAVAVLSGYDPNRRLDQGVLQQIFFGAGLGALTAGLGSIPGYAKYLRGADTEVRNKPGTRPDTGEESGSKPPPLPIQPAPPGGPEQQAQANVSETQGQPPTAVISAQGSPEDQLRQGLAKIHETQDQQAAAPTTGPTVETMLAQQLGRPVGTPEELDQARADITRDMSKELTQPLALGLGDREPSTTPEILEARRAAAAGEGERETGAPLQLGWPSRPEPEPEVAAPAPVRTPEEENRLAAAKAFLERPDALKNLNQQQLDRLNQHIDISIRNGMDLNKVLNDPDVQRHILEGPAPATPPAKSTVTVGGGPVPAEEYTPKFTVRAYTSGKNLPRAYEVNFVPHIGREGGTWWLTEPGKKPRQVSDPSSAMSDISIRAEKNGHKIELDPGYYKDQPGTDNWQRDLKESLGYRPDVVRQPKQVAPTPAPAPAPSAPLIQIGHAAMQAAYERYKPLFEALGIPIKEPPVWAAQRGMKFSLSFTPTGKMEFWLDPETARGIAATRPGVEDTAMEEELIHAAEKVSLRNEWQNTPEGKKYLANINQGMSHSDAEANGGKSFRTYAEEHGKAIYKELLQAEAAADARGDTKLANDLKEARQNSWKLYATLDIDPSPQPPDYTERRSAMAELVRQLVQIRKDHPTTDEFKSLWSTVRDWLNRALDGLKSLAGSISDTHLPLLNSAVRKTEAMLESIGGLPEIKETPQHIKISSMEKAFQENPVEARAQQKVYDGLTDEEEKKLQSGDPETIAKFQQAVAALKDQWSKQSNEVQGEGVQPPGEEKEPEEPITQRDVKAETNRAATAMGLDQVVHYVPDAESLPERVKKTLTDGERNSTAQTVWDNSMHDLWVIGDRFSSKQDLQRALIEETQSKVWRDVTDLKFTNDPNDSRHGYYDIQSDRPVLNTNALLRSNDPYTNAKRAALEEVAVHQGFSKLLGPREGRAYVDAMTGLQRQFDRLRITDMLAREKGFKNVEEMAREYGFEDYASNPRHQHALTEELAGAYAQRFGSREELEASAPRWYGNALRMLSDGIRRHLGMQVEPLDVQHLMADSMAALRSPKYAQDGRYSPELVNDAQLQMAARRGDEAGVLHEGVERQEEFPFSEVRPPPLPKPPEPVARDVASLAEANAMRRAQNKPIPGANIGDLFVKGQIRDTNANLEPGQGLRQQPQKLAMQAFRSLRERMGLASPETLVYDEVTRKQATDEASHIFNDLYKGDIHMAMQEMREMHDPGAINPFLYEMTNRATNKQIDNYRSLNMEEAARSLELERDKFNQDMAARPTKVAQELAFQRFLTKDGSWVIGTTRNSLSKMQQRLLAPNAKVSNVYRQILDQSKSAAQKMVNMFSPELSAAERRRMADPRSLARQYIEAVAQSIDASMAKAGLANQDRPMLQKLFNTFQRNIEQQIKDAGVSLPETFKQRPTPTQSIRDVINNIGMFKATWEATIDKLRYENPNALFFHALDRAMAEPFGETAVRKVIGESNKITDLIYNHYSTQNRVGNDLARSLVDQTSVDPFTALQIQNNFDKIYRQILEKESASALQRALDSLGTRSAIDKPTKNELGRLIDLMAIGGFDEKEHYNLIAERYGMGAWNPDLVDGMKKAGDELQRLRDAGLMNSVIANRYRAQIADLMQLTAPNLSRAWRYGQSMYMASILTGEITHTAYFLQNKVTGLINAWIHALPTAMRTGDWQAFAKMHLDALQGFGRAITTDIPYIYKTGMLPTRGIAETGFGGETHVGDIPFRSPLERAPAWMWYKYVSRTLASLEQFAFRGTEYAMNRTIASNLADKFGYHGQDAQRFADEAVYGTEAKLSQAKAQSLEEQQKYGFDENTRKVREGEILDSLRTESDNPDGGIADEETEALQNMETQATMMGLHSVYREDVPGGAGVISRALTQMRAKAGAMTFITPFIKLPANLANAFAAWSPVGIWRGQDLYLRGGKGVEFMLGGEEQGGKRTGYYGAIPGFHERYARGEVPTEFLRAMAYEQLVKGVIGTAAMGAIGVYMAQNKDNPDAPFWITADGPSTGSKEDLAKATGWNRFSVKIGDHWYSYENSEFRGMLAALGGIGDYLRYEAKPQDQNFGSAVLAGATAMGRSTLGSPLQGLASSLTFLSGRGAQAQREIGQFATQLASALALVPVGGTLVRQTYRGFVNQKEYEAPAKDWSAKFLRNIPVVNEWAAQQGILQPKLNVLGEPVQSNPWNRNVFVPTTVPEDPVWNYIAHSGLTLQLPGNSAKVDGVQATPAELHEYHLARGQFIKEQLAHLIADPSFTSLPMDIQNMAVKDLERDSREVGDAAVVRMRNR